VDAVPNEVLQRLRLDRGWTQDQVAARARAYIKQKYGKTVAIDANRISKLELGETTWPGANYQEALAAVFGTSADQLGFYSKRTRRDAEVSATKRRDFLAGSGAMALPVLLGLPGPTSRLGHGDVDEFEERISALAGLQRQAGGGVTSTLCTPEMRRAVAIADNLSMTPSVRARWNAGIARLAGTAVWSAFDSQQEDIALKLLDDGLNAADEANDPGMLAFVCEVGARLHVQERRSGSALELLGRTRGAIPPSVAATSAALAARAHAINGDAREVFRELDAADAAFSRADHDTSVLATYNQAGKHHADVSDALFELAGTTGYSDPELLRRLNTSLELLPADRPRTHAVAAAKLATTLYRMGEREAGDHWASAARNSAFGIKSSRTQIVLRDMDAERVRIS
jgi:transcriptional regulator with XRE-family HTH domain